MYIYRDAANTPLQFTMFVQLIAFKILNMQKLANFSSYNKQHFSFIPLAFFSISSLLHFSSLAVSSSIQVEIWCKMLWVNKCLQKWFWLQTLAKIFFFMIKCGRSRKKKRKRNEKENEIRNKKKWAMKTIKAAKERCNIFLKPFYQNANMCRFQFLICLLHSIIWCLCIESVPIRFFFSTIFTRLLSLLRRLSISFLVVDFIWISINHFNRKLFNLTKLHRLWDGMVCVCVWCKSYNEK